MEGLVKVRFGNADEILEPAGHRRPERMDQAQDRVAVDLAVGDDPDRDQVIHIFEGDPLLQHLLVDAVKMLGPSLHLTLVAVLGKLPLHDLDQFVDVGFPLDPALGHLLDRSS